FALFWQATFNLQIFRWTGSTWVVESLQAAWGLAAAAMILYSQYRWRKTIPARWAAGAAGLIWFALQLLPWQTVFAIQKRFSKDPAAASPVQIVFEPALGKMHGPREGASPFSRRQEGDVQLWLPLRVGGG